VILIAIEEIYLDILLKLLDLSELSR